MALVNELHTEFPSVCGLGKDGLAAFGVASPFVKNHASGEVFPITSFLQQEILGQVVTDDGISGSSPKREAKLQPMAMPTSMRRPIAGGSRCKVDWILAKASLFGCRKVLPKIIGIFLEGDGHRDLM